MTGSDGSLQILGYIKGNKEVEHFLHQYFSKYRIRSNGEWFAASEEIISFINTYNEMNVLVFVNEYYDNKLMAEIRLGIDYNIKKFNIDEFKRDMELL